MNSGVSRRLIVTAALAAGLGLVAVGCSAGQVTQTDTQVAAVDGASGNADPIAVRRLIGGALNNLGKLSTFFGLHYREYR